MEKASLTQSHCTNMDTAGLNFDELVFQAQLSLHLNLYDDMRQCCQKMLTDYSDRITLEARNLISLSLKHCIDPHRAASQHAVSVLRQELDKARHYLSTDCINECKETLCIAEANWLFSQSQSQHIVTKSTQIIRCLLQHHLPVLLWAPVIPAGASLLDLPRPVWVSESELCFDEQLSVNPSSEPSEMQSSQCLAALSWLFSFANSFSQSDTTIIQDLIEFESAFAARLTAVQAALLRISEYQIDMLIYSLKLLCTHYCLVIEHSRVDKSHAALCDLQTQVFHSSTIHQPDTVNVRRYVRSATLCFAVSELLVSTFLPPANSTRLSVALQRYQFVQNAFDWSDGTSAAGQSYCDKAAAALRLAYSVARTDLSRRGWAAARVPWRQQDQQPAPSGSVDLTVSSKETSELMHRIAQVLNEASLV